MALEHRFYGKSQPTGDLTVESLQYLTSDQASRTPRGSSAKSRRRSGWRERKRTPRSRERRWRFWLEKITETRVLSSLASWRSAVRTLACSRGGFGCDTRTSSSRRWLRARPCAPAWRCPATTRWLARRWRSRTWGLGDLPLGGRARVRGGGALDARARRKAKAGNDVQRLFTSREFAKRTAVGMGGEPRGEFLAAPPRSSRRSPTTPRATTRRTRRATYAARARS